VGERKHISVDPSVNLLELSEALYVTGRRLVNLSRAYDDFISQARTNSLVLNT
jgi:hypothetical protein